MSEVQVPLTIVDFFKFLGTPVFVGFVVSFLLERAAFFQALSSDAKALGALLIAVLFSLLSYALVNYVPSALIEALEPWYAAAVTAVIGFVASQVWHRLFNAQPTPPTEFDDYEQ